MAVLADNIGPCSSILVSARHHLNALKFMIIELGYNIIYTNISMISGGVWNPGNEQCHWK